MKDSSISRDGLSSRSADLTTETVLKDNMPRIYRLAISLAGNPADADDICQEAMLQIVRSLPGFKGDAAVSTWVYRITLRTAYRWLAKQRRKTPESVPPAAVDDGLPLDLLAALNRLPMEARTLIMMVSVEGMTHREAAAVLGIPEGTVASRLHNARKKLRQLLV